MNYNVNVSFIKSCLYFLERLVELLDLLSLIASMIGIAQLRNENILMLNFLNLKLC